MSMHECTQCGVKGKETNVKVTICWNCLRPVVYGATPAEKRQAGKDGACILGTLTALFMFLVPYLANKYFGTDWAMGYGLGFYSILIVAGAALCGYVWWIDRIEKEMKDKVRTL